MIAQPSTIKAAHKTAERFYRPELDALRFFAFLAVLIHHGPDSKGWPVLVSRLGGFGLSMFFLLSAYLISELLFREREQTGTIAWNLFFTRRALRIWPLYYAALAGTILLTRLVPRIAPYNFRISGSGIAGMSFFVANWLGAGQLGRLVGPLWSISIEEQFYIIWPPIVKAGGRRLALIAAIFFAICASVWLWVFYSRGGKLWYDTPVEFLFFAAGVIIAIATHGRPMGRLGVIARSCLLAAGLFSFVTAVLVGRLGTDNVEGITRTNLYFGYGAAVAGCVLVFFAILGFPNIPRPLTYLGKISYGLYVFHAGIMTFSMRLIVRLRLVPSSVSYMLVVDSVALLLCILAAHLSYKYFETPFLRLKERFEVVRSRPA
jgi:peptidoglycan/LPS O-acetylase OafA/YrhL